MLGSIVWAIHLLVSLMMTGIIWFVQWIHYPLFQKVPQASFVSYEMEHTLRTGQLVGPLMVIELGTGIGLLIWPVDVLSMLWASINLGGIILLWLSTFMIQVPLHGALSEQKEESSIRKLVLTNWIRTIIWTLRSILLIWMIVK